MSILDPSRQIVAGTREYTNGNWGFFVAYGNPDGPPIDWEMVYESTPCYESYDAARESVSYYLKLYGPKDWILDRSVFGLDDPKSILERKGLSQETIRD